MRAPIKWFLPVILTLILYPWQIHGYINGLDEGTFLSIAQALYSGKKLYQDVWFQYGPLLALPLKAAVAFQHPTLFSVRLWIWAANIVGLLCAYLALNKVASTTAVRLVTALAIWSVPLAAHTTTIPMSFRYGFPLLSILFWDTSDGRRLVASGFMAGSAFFLSQEVATAAIVGGFVFYVLALPRKIQIYRYLAGVAVAFGLFGLYVSTRYGFGNYWMCTVRQTAGLLAIRRGFFANHGIESVALIFPLLIATFALATSYKKPLFAGLAVFVLLAAIPAWGRSDRWHIYYSLTPALLLAAALADRRGSVVKAFLAVCVLSLTLPHVVADTGRKRAAKRSSRVLDVPRSGDVRVPFGQANGYEYLVRFSDEHIAPTDSVLMFPYDGAFPFLANRNFPCRFPLLIEAVSEQQKEQLAACVRATPDLQWVIRDKQNTSFDGLPVEARLKPIVEAIDENFSVVASYGPFDFLKRNDPR